MPNSQPYTSVQIAQLPYRPVSSTNLGNGVPPDDEPDDKDDFGLSVDKSGVGNKGVFSDYAGAFGTSFSTSIVTGKAVPASVISSGTSVVSPPPFQYMFVRWIGTDANDEVFRARIFGSRRNSYGVPHSDGLSSPILLLEIDQIILSAATGVAGDPVVDNTVRYADQFTITTDKTRDTSAITVGKTASDSAVDLVFDFSGYAFITFEFTNNGVTGTGAATFSALWSVG